MSRPLDQHTAAQVADCLSIGDFIPLFTAIPLTEFCFHHEFPMFFKDFSLGGPGFAPFDMNDTLIFLRSQPWSTAATVFTLASKTGDIDSGRRSTSARRCSFGCMEEKER
ncbi:hypothetical protein DFP72DRAFT_1068274 [Ephemerocybe angulata]|uniref:Uncharacterized protein n=1 Tax=Ephemerocybe angulata TaxID=980116 RepID=A0A8H6HYJ8_9AGAR|nr:hypothetical protein DFP72DRAFT_1068274 [Tulosesus angulatus]